jgi:carotenoid cleavage dioxygenase-like enzyme
MTDGTSTFHDFGPGRSTSEPVFVPVDGDAAEDEGWVLSFVYDKAEGSSSFVVLDASDMSAEPVATVAIPQRVPHGFHGSWLPDVE